MSALQCCLRAWLRAGLRAGGRLERARPYTCLSARAPPLNRLPPG
jgi:hypothetical protein